FSLPRPKPSRSWAARCSCDRVLRFSQNFVLPARTTAPVMPSPSAIVRAIRPHVRTDDEVIESAVKCLRFATKKCDKGNRTPPTGELGRQGQREIDTGDSGEGGQHRDGAGDERRLVRRPRVPPRVTEACGEDQDDRDSAGQAALDQGFEVVVVRMLLWSG